MRGHGVCIDVFIDPRGAIRQRQPDSPALLQRTAATWFHVHHVSCIHALPPFLQVMVMETTGALQLIVPLMLTVFFAKVGGWGLVA